MIVVRNRFRRAFYLPQARLLSREPLSDWQLFWMTFIAGFLAFSGMIW